VPRISGVDLPKEKRIEVSLCYIYGIGPSISKKTLAACGVNPDTRAKDLTEEEVSKLTSHIQKECLVEGDLRRENSAHLKRLMEVGCYRGIRHRKNLPVRGQRTKTNARTRKGPKKTVGVRKGSGSKTGLGKK